jgi:hypothetical protein
MRWRLVTAAAGAVVAVAGTAVVWHETRSHSPVPEALRAGLTARVVDLLEHDPGWRTETTSDPGWQPVCDDHVFGLDPVGARSISQVHTVYAWVECRWLPPAGERAGVAMRESPAEVVPIAVRLGSPDTYEVPRDGEDTYPADMERIFPRDLWDAAFGPDPALDAARATLEDRVRALLD